MSELTFCKQFLSALDARPIKLSSDHIADARQYPAQGAFTLPKLPHPPHPQRPNPKSTSQAATSSSSASSISITLKPMKPSSPAVPLSSIDPTKTSIFDLKQSYSTSTSIPTSKIKILWKKKPATDSKTVSEVVGADSGSDVEFSVMLMGGAVAGTPVTSPPAVAPSEEDKGLGTQVPPSGEVGSGAAAGPSGKEVVASKEFWDDLNGFVLQRIKDETEATRLVGLFRAAWEKDR